LASYIDERELSFLALGERLMGGIKIIAERGKEKKGI